MSKPELRAPAFEFRGVPRVIDLGYVQNVPGHATRLLDFSVLGIVTSGQVGIETSSATMTVEAGSYYLLPALIPHQGHGTSRFDVVFFHFLPSEPSRDGLPAVELPLTGPTSPLVDYFPLFRLLESQYRTGLLDGDELGMQLLAIAGQLAVLHRRRPAAPADSASTVAKSVLELLHTEYPADLSGPAISARLGYSYAYLERVFRASYDRSIHQELLRTRIQAAAHGLQMGKTIKDIAREVGFSDYYYFLKAFKRVTGVSPGAFQASYRSRDGRRPERASRAGQSGSLFPPKCQGDCAGESRLPVRLAGNPGPRALPPSALRLPPATAVCLREMDERSIASVHLKGQKTHCLTKNTPISWPNVRS